MINLPIFFKSMIDSHALLAFGLLTLFYSFTLPLSEEMILVVIGVIANSLDKNFLIVLLVSYPGIYISDLGYYGLAWHFGGRILRSKFFSKMINSEKLLALETYFKRSGAKLIFFCRFLVGIRAPTMIASGILRVKFAIFALYDGIAALMATVLWLSLGYFFSHIWTEYATTSTGVVLAVLGPVFFVVLLVIAYLKLKQIWKPYEVKTVETNND